MGEGKSFVIAAVTFRTVMITRLLDYAVRIICIVSFQQERLERKINYHVPILDTSHEENGPFFHMAPFLSLPSILEVVLSLAGE